MASEAEAKVIYLQSHPVWTAARRHERQLQEAIRRHPAYIGRQRALAMGGSVVTDRRSFNRYGSADAPA